MRTDFGGGSWQSRILGLVVRNTAKRVIFAWTVAPNLPWPYFVVDHLGRFQKKAPGTTIEHVSLPSCNADLIRTPASDSGRVIVYFHGGAFLVGGRHLHHGLISRIAEATRSDVLAVDYRQLPKHPISCSTADCLEGYKWALEQGFAPEGIVFMGDSAGGFLSFTTADLAGEQGLPKPAAIVSISPLVDFDFERIPFSIGPRGCDVFGPGFKKPFLRLAQHVEGEGVLRSPVDCEFEYLPPVLLQASSSESLYSQVTHMHDLLEAGGVPVELQVWDEQMHVFQAARLIPEAKEAVEQIAEYVERATPAVRRKTA
ncbi:MAG TPA: alpha/beta hydrolase [Nocardioidaceae bacterium]|nr:alpha/beta hydrolase [Nocardioidaceae bacterium]